VDVGGVACNWLPFGTKVLIGSKLYTVEDRGAKSIFGTKNDHKKAIDIYFESHEEALEFGVQRLKVEIL
jgi:3D (Asp-Asp-Asp) domain-containing protein